MPDTQEQVNSAEVSSLKKRLKNLSKNELVRLVIFLGNDIGFLKAQNEQLDSLIQGSKGESDD